MQLPPIILIHEDNPLMSEVIQTTAYAVMSSNTIDGELTMQNKIRVHPKQLKKMLKEPFWKKMYEADPDKFEVTDTPADDKEESDEES